MSRTIIARTPKSILNAVKNGAKLTVASQTKTWTNATGKQSKTTGTLCLDGQEVALEFEDVRCAGGLRLATFENSKNCVSTTLSWSDEQAAEFLELEKLIVKDGLFVTYNDILKKFKEPDNFMEFKWTGAVMPLVQAKDKSGELVKDKYYPRASFVDCPMEKRDGATVPAFPLKNADNTDVACWNKLEKAKMTAKKIHVTYEISVSLNLEKNFKVKLICRYLKLAEGGHVTTISESMLSDSEPVKESTPAVVEPDSKRRKIEPVVAATKPPDMTVPAKVETIKAK